MPIKYDVWNILISFLLLICKVCHQRGPSKGIPQVID